MVWRPEDGQTYTAGTAVGDSQTVLSVTNWTSYSDNSLTNGVRYYYQIFSYNSEYVYTAGPTSSLVAGITCPTNYLAIGPNTAVGVSSAFCIAKYEMKNSGGTPVTTSAGSPWAIIGRDTNGGILGAIVRCQSLGAGYDLTSNAQWQAVARDIETATDGLGNYLNWSNGSTSGSNFMNTGHTDNVPPNSLAASTDNDPCFGTGQTNCADNTHADFRQKRTHTLSTGDVIWDASGNLTEWLKTDIPLGPPWEVVSNFVSQRPWLTGLNNSDKWGTVGTYTSKSSGIYGGLGYQTQGGGGTGVRRGSCFNEGIASGVFHADINYNPQGTSLYDGFRCVYQP